MDHLRQSVIAFLFLAVALHAGDKKKQAYYLKPDQTADLTSPKIVTAKQNCENWALAAGLETMLQKQNVSLDQTFWVMRLNYGELCVTAAMCAWRCNLFPARQGMLKPSSSA